MSNEEPKCTIHLDLSGRHWTDRLARFCEGLLLFLCALVLGALLFWSPAHAARTISIMTAVTAKSGL